MVVKREMDFRELQNNCWSGATDTLQTIWENDKEDEFMDFLEMYFTDGEIPTMTEVNDFLWFEDEYIFSELGINSDEEDDDDDEEDDDDFDSDFEYELSKGDDEYTERVAQEIIERS